MWGICELGGTNVGGKGGEPVSDVPYGRLEG